MTAQQAIHRLDTLHPNAYSYGEKLAWLTAAEGHIYNEIYSYHQNLPQYQGLEEQDGELYLSAPEPYHWLYHYYLQGQILYANGEIEGYNNAMALYNRMFREYWRFYQKSRPSLGISLSVLS